MRLDHIAYRVADRNKTAEFFKKAPFHYRIQTDGEFNLDFDDGSTAQCIAMEPYKPKGTAYGSGTLDSQLLDWTFPVQVSGMEDPFLYHMAPEIFISDGPPGSIVGDWVAKRDGIGGIHHMAYQVESVAETMKEWKKIHEEFKFLSDEPMSCPTDDLIQVFTKPHPLTGVIYEFIERGEHGFCKDNVKELMESTRDIDIDQEAIDRLKNLDMG